MNETKETVRTKLNAVQTELAAPKSQSGRFGKHRNVEDILAAVKPLLRAYKAIITLDNKTELVGDHYYINATASFYNAESDEPPVVVSAQAWEGDLSRGLDAPQVTGSASSYARKYALGGLLAIDDTKDPDSHKDDPEPIKAPTATKPEPPKDTDPATPQQKQQLKNMMAALAMEPEAMSLMVESVLNKPTVDTYGDFNKVLEAMETVDDSK